MSGHSSHNHTHAHNYADVKGVKLLFVIALNFVITGAQILGGLVSGSLALISDALHNFSDAIAVIISYIALRVSRRNGDTVKTFGYKRATILAALLNSSVLIVIAFILIREAVERLANPRAIDGSTVIWVALVGLVADFFSVLLLRRNAHGDINLKASYLHMLSDTLSSVGVLTGGILIRFFQVCWVDPVLTFLIAAYVLIQSYRIVKKAVAILMQSVPDGIDVEEIRRRLETLDDIEDIHHIHVWSLDEHSIHFEAHANVCDMPVSQTKAITLKMKDVLTPFGITHTTIQYEHRCCLSNSLVENNSGKKNCP